jgi:hypothetical protein
MNRLLICIPIFFALALPSRAEPPAAIDFAKARQHWAYQPVRKPALPALKQADWPATPLDAYVLAKLEAAGLMPSPAADRRTWLRRVTYDLVGLPPTPVEIDAFLNDKSPEAFATVVERLLASPQHGERWGRHWLDIARYADTKDGVLMYGDDRVRPYAYTYRDYVVRAFNDDVPYDRFVHEQLAADLIEPKVDAWRLAALGFLTLGRMFDNNIHDVIDDRIDTATRGFLGLTVACARCHDHKYDAIPTQDYYSLYGVFASAEAPIELPPIEPLDSKPEYVAFEKQAGPKRRELQKFLDDQYALLSEAARQRVGDYLARAATTEPDPLETAVFFMSLAPTDLRPPIVARWRQFLAKRATPDDPVFGPWYELMRRGDADLASHVGDACGSRSINPLVRDALTNSKPKTKGEVAAVYGTLLLRIYAESKKSPPSDAARKQLLGIVTNRDSPPYFPKTRTWSYMSRQEKDAFGGKVQELDKMAVKAPGAPPRAMALADTVDVYDPCVFVRGSAARHGESVPRQFLRILAGDDRKPFAHGSGRLDLARAITDPANPLTARVMVNRVWMHHFGEPLVASPSDFGTRSAPPAQAELLDYLAWAFVHECNWSLKKLHKLIVLSAAYRQESFDRPECRKVDPDNRLLWRFNRRRLDLEAMRDTLLAVSGRLDPTMGGRPVDVAGDPKNCRRTMYGLVDRQSVPGVFRAFDFASPDASCERRPRTIVPQQALFGLNSPFVLEQARALAARPEVAKESAPDRRIAALYRLVLGRAPDRDEVAAGLRFVQSTGKSKLTPWEEYAQVLLLTNEAMFVD